MATSQIEPSIAQLIREFNQEWDIDALFVADAALYSTENLKPMKSLRWLSRVPATIKQTQELLTLDSGIFQDSEIQGYRIAEMGSYYCHQRIQGSTIYRERFSFS